jgi:hypothetical protein
VGNKDEEEQDLLMDGVMDAPADDMGEATMEEQAMEEAPM